MKTKKSGLKSVLINTILVIIVMTLFALVLTNLTKRNSTQTDHYPTVSKVTVQSQNTSLCYNVVTHFSNDDHTKPFTLLDKVTCTNVVNSTNHVWDFIYLPETDYSAQQCFETLIMYQEVFLGQDDLTKEVTAMIKVPCNKLLLE